MSNILEQELDTAFVTPQRQFKENALADYTEGSRILLSQIRDDGDSGAFFVWAFVYLHILIAKDRKKAISLAWNKDSFRESLLDWVSSKTREDFILAEELVLSIINEANKSAVEAIPSVGDLKELGNK